MITLITAVPGSGKTLFAIGLIIDALNEKRPVYTNINGLVKDKFPNNHLLFDAPSDWRECPHGAFVVYDEAQQPHLYPANAQRGLVSDERLTDMETHRHGGYDLVFITQAPTFIHHHIRKLVGRHVHLYRSSGIQGAVRYEWSHVCDSPNDRREQQRADSVIWKFPKQHFSFYTSAVKHTHKFKLPFKIAFIFGFILILFAFVAYRLFSGGGFGALSTDFDTVPIPTVSTKLSSSSSWRLKGYITIGNVRSVGHSLALIENDQGQRLIDFQNCSFDDHRLFITCSFNGENISFLSGIN